MTTMKLKRDEICKLATSRGIRNTKKYNVRELCELLDIPFIPGKRNMTTPYLVKDMETGIETEYSSGYRVMKAIGTDQRFYSYAKTQKPITINGIRYIIKKLERQTI